MTEQHASLYDIPHFFAPRARFAPTCRCGKGRHDAVHLTPGDSARMQRAVDTTGDRGRAIAREQRKDRRRRRTTRRDGAA